MLSLQGITKTYLKAYDGGQVETTALRSVSLSIQEGEFVSVAGPSGSGKSTLLSVLGLLDRQSAGAYQFDGEDVGGLNDEQLSRTRLEKIGFVFQNFNLLPELTLYQNIEAPLRYRRMSVRQRRERVTEMLETFGLRGRAHHYPSELSGGQQQRTAIARAIAGRPRVILADEPTGNLDSEMSRQILGLIKDINLSGVTVVLVTHDEAIAQTADRRIEIVDGAVVTAPLQ